MMALRGVVSHSVAVAAAVILLIAEVAVANSPRLVCQMSEALLASVDEHIEVWEQKIASGLNKALNCSQYLERTYDSGEGICNELQNLEGNFTQQIEDMMIKGEAGLPTSEAMTYMARGASIISAHLHIHGRLVVARQECLSEHLQLAFLMGLRRRKMLLEKQFRQMWVVYQGTPELLPQGAATWLAAAVEHCKADVQMFDTVMQGWHPPPSEVEVLEGKVPPLGRPGPPLPRHSAREPNGIALSTVDVLRRETFGEWTLPKPAYRALLRYVLPRDGYVADFCAGGGFFANFLNDTGLLTAYAFDASPNIAGLTDGMVEYAPFGLGEVKLWRSFDMVVCLSADANFASKPDAWAKAWRTIDAHTSRAAILNCGKGSLREQALAAALRFAPELVIDQVLSDQLDVKAPGICIFWRGPPPSHLE